MILGQICLEGRVKTIAVWVKGRNQDDSRVFGLRKFPCFRRPGFTFLGQNYLLVPYDMKAGRGLRDQETTKRLRDLNKVT